ncbi:hypothetical protein O181_123104 [Austropuccinia psidii MF-1]|uniref:Uncharacterized protein n=1 Tax=Austropuccinia psidii MF-1 TaxID=1389203 RepID=A0A9Q3KPD3_9BASI|nr:hypothetical protein [Austropuccinia psidii MF-1]
MLNPRQRAKLDASLKKSSTAPLADATNQPEKKIALFVPKEERSGPRIKSIEILEAPHPATMPRTLDPPPTFFEQSLLNAFQDVAAAAPLPPPPTVVQTADPPLTAFEKNL